MIDWRSDLKISYSGYSEWSTRCFLLLRKELEEKRTIDLQERDNLITAFLKDHDLYYVSIKSIDKLNCVLYSLQYFNSPSILLESEGFYDREK